MTSKKREKMRKKIKKKKVKNNLCILYEIIEKSKEIYGLSMDRLYIFLFFSK
jgi:hypothetical protein